MKKLLHLLLVCALCISLTACSVGNNPGGTSAKPENSTGTDTHSADPGNGWPNGTVNIYVPAKAGGGTDMLVRICTTAFKDYNGGNYVVVNDMTGNGTVAMENVRNAAPDGQNVMVYSSICAAMASGVYNHTLDEFTCLGAIATEPDECTGGIYVRSDSPFQSFEEMVSYAKENPGELVAAVQSGGGSQYFIALLAKECGFEVTMVDSGSNADRITAILGGTVDISFISNTGTTQYVESGDMRCLVTLGQSGAPRTSQLPDVPTLEECGYDMGQVYLPNILPVYGPVGIDEPTVAAIDAMLKAACEDASVQEQYTALNNVWTYMTPAEVDQVMRQSLETYISAVELIAEG